MKLIKMHKALHSKDDTEAVCQGKKKKEKEKESPTLRIA